MRPFSTGHRLPLARAALVAALCLSAAFAQTAPPERPTPAADEREAAAREFPLQQVRSSFPALGVSLRLPENAVFQSSELGTDRQSITMVAADRRWTIRLLDRRTRDVAITPDELAADLIRELRATRQQMDGSGRVGSAVSIDPGDPDFRLGESPTAQFYAGFLSSANQPVISGYTIGLLEPGRLLVVQLDTTAEHAGVALDVYERVLSSIEMRNPADVAARRAAAIKAGQAFLNSLPASEYLAALPDEPVQWHRTVAPDPSSTDGLREVGYQRVEMRTGKRGELDPQKPSSRWNQSELEDGILVKIEARAVLNNGAPGAGATPGSNPALQIVDSQAIYWMKLDAEGRGEESWSVRMVLNERGEKSVYTEVGARLGDQLTVTVNAPGTQPIEKRWRAPEGGYIAQAETHLLPRLLARGGAQTDMAFYAYSSSLNEIKLRTERLSKVHPEQDESAPRDAAWKLRTEIAEGAAPRVTYLTEDGRVVRTQLPDGSIVAPTTPEEVRAAWRRKGLPTN